MKSFQVIDSIINRLILKKFPSIQKNSYLILLFNQNIPILIILVTTQPYARGGIL